jgi:hypothetical protein
VAPTRTRTGLVVSVLALALVALVLAVVASADDGGGSGRHDGNDQGRGKDDNGARVFASPLAPSLTTDPTIHGVSPGNLPWALGSGRVTIRLDGRVRVDLQGLVIPIAHGGFPADTARPVTTVSASLYCAPDASTAAATTDAAPISASGNARIVDTVTLPPTCLAPTVLIHPNGATGAYIALPGWRS